MNSLSERANALAKVAADFPLLGKITEADCLELVALELGDAGILDGFRSYGKNWAFARARSPLLHIVSGNTPHAGLQSLMRGLLIGAQNRVKIPKEGLPELEAFVAALPEALRARVEVSRELPSQWWGEAKACVVFGSDETLAHFRKRAGAGMRLLEHGHRLSVGLIWEDPKYQSLEAAAHDVSVFDQKGCLSPHCIYVREGEGLIARTYAQKLAEAMATFDARTPRGAISREEAAEIFNLRTNYQFRSANDPRVQIWSSEGNDHWTVIYEDDPWFATSCLNRCVFVKPLPSNWAESLAPVRPWLSAVGVWPAMPDQAFWLADLGFRRICSLGKMQIPPLTWHQDGEAVLANLIEWVDFENESC